jgi:hypothetical protein
LFFGHNEECGLRCVYHGWKFDAQGRCVDMPSEPPDSLFREKVTLTAYPTWEAAGIVWAYLGPAEHRPPLPNFELLRTPPTHRFVSKTFEECNYLQAIEGGVDPTHATILHNPKIGDRSFLNDYDALVARLEHERTDYGFSHVALRSLPEAEWVRIYHFVMPGCEMRATHEGPFRQGDDAPTINGHIWVPIDDERTFVYNFLYSLDPGRPISVQQALEHEVRFGRGPEDLQPGFRLKRNRSNDYLIDRQQQKTKSFSGIAGVNTQDFALQEGMGAIVDRSREHLGTSDRIIILLRKLLLEAADAVANGEAPRGLDPASYERLRPIDRKVPRGSAWRDVVAADLLARF